MKCNLESVGEECKLHLIQACAKKRLRVPLLGPNQLDSMA